MSKGLHNERISSATGFAYPSLIYDNPRIKVKFDGSILKQNKNIYFGSIINIYIVYSLISSTKNSNIVLENCFFGAMEVKNTTNIDPNKYEYLGCIGIGFASKGSYTHPGRGFGKNIIIFGADMRNPKHANNKTKNVLVLGRDLIQKIDDTTIYAEKMY